MGVNLGALPLQVDLRRRRGRGRHASVDDAAMGVRRSHRGPRDGGPAASSPASPLATRRRYAWPPKKGDANPNLDKRNQFSSND